MPLNIFSRNRTTSRSLPLFDEAFLRRLERLSLRTVPSLRGAMLGERRSRNLRPALDFSDHRPYVAGDDLRHVDWNAFGRHEELFVKLGEATQSVNVHILLDRSRSMDWEANQKPATATRASNKWDKARRLTGAMAYLALSGGERLKITPFAQTLEASFGPTQGKRQVISILQFLAATKSAPLFEGAGHRGLGLANTLAAYAQTNPGGGLLVLISDLLDISGVPFDNAFAADGLNETSWGQDLAEGLRHLPPPRWQVLVMHLLTEQEMDPTLEGDYDLQDVETKDSLPFHLDRDTLARYRLRVRRWCATMKSACAGRGATYVRVLAEWPTEQAVIPYLRQRGVVQ